LRDGSPGRDGGDEGGEAAADGADEGGGAGEAGGAFRDRVVLLLIAAVPLSSRCSSINENDSCFHGLAKVFPGTFENDDPENAMRRLRGKALPKRPGFARGRTQLRRSSSGSP